MAKPVRREGRHPVQCSGLLEQMGGARDNHQLFRASQFVERMIVEVHHEVVAPADNEQRWCLDPRQRLGPGEIGPASSRNDCIHRLTQFRRRNQCRRPTRACTKVSNAQMPGGCVVCDPLRRSGQATRQQIDIETKSGVVGIFVLFRTTQQIEEQRSHAGLMNFPGDKLVPGTMTTTPATVREQDNANGVQWLSKISRQDDSLLHRDMHRLCAKECGRAGA